MGTYKKLSLILSLFVINLMSVVVRADIADIPDTSSSNYLPIFAAVMAAIVATFAALKSRNKK